MSDYPQRIQVFEHQRLRVNKTYGEYEVVFEEKHFNALVKYNEFHNNHFFDVGHQNIKFKQYVGILQIDGLSIEILPKVNGDSNDEAMWQSVLVEMLRQTKRIKVKLAGNASVNKQQIHLLDIYFEWFLSEVKDLIRKGLIRQYYKKRDNLNALKGKLVFGQHLSKNAIHKERFYTEHQVYERDHLIHQILQQALDIVTTISRGTYLHSSCKSVQLDFPEVKYIKATQQTFDTLVFNRKNEGYKTALEIARLIILNYAPNITSGNENMLALLFDMNILWEEYILGQLQKAAQHSEYKVLGQRSEKFWKSITIIPDIVIQKDLETFCIIDTKWKNIGYGKPSTSDLRQMFVYNEYWQSPLSILLYPTSNERKENVEPFKNQTNNTCGLCWVSVLKEGKLNIDIGSELLNKVKAISSLH